MSNETIREMLELEHRDIDKGIVGILEGGGDFALLATCLELLRKHIHMEEEVLFPALAAENHIYTMPISMMEIEHGYMWPMILDLEAMTRTGTVAGREGLVTLCGALYELLELHNKREEDILYSGADRISDNEGRRTGLAHGVAHVVMPTDWTCLLAAA